MAIIVPPTLLDPVASALGAAGITFGRVGERALDERVTLLTIEDAKGLEFDAVTVVEPARIVQETPRGCEPSTWPSPGPPRCCRSSTPTPCPPPSRRPCRRSA